VPGIHALLTFATKKDVDGRNKSGHDAGDSSTTALRAPSPRVRGEGWDEGAHPLPEPSWLALTAQTRGDAPSPSLRSTSPRTRGEVSFWSPRRQHRDRIDLVDHPVIGQRADLDHGRGRHARRIEVFQAKLAQRFEVRLQVDEIMLELDDVLEARARRSENTLDVEERLLRLRAMKSPGAPTTLPLMSRPCWPAI
jgi:hypothetical protein